MELYIVPKGAGKYSITDNKDRNLYNVTKAKKLFGNPITTLHDASGYALYTMQRTASGKKPAFQIVFNDEPFLKSIYVDPCVIFEGKNKYELKSKDGKNFQMYMDGTVIGKLETSRQANNDPRYFIQIEDKFFDDFIPLFAVCIDKCFSGLNK
jgi:uncharacterized protein YxjI